MTHGRSTKTRVDRRRENSISLLTRVSREPEESLESRVARLEARVEQMQEEIDRASGVVPAHIRKAIDSIGKKHPGPRKKIDDTELLLNRDNLIYWLEEHWPRIVQPLLTAKNQSEAAAVLTAIAAPRDIRPTWQSRMVDHPGELMEFLRSKKFRRKPPKKTVVDALRLYQSEQRQRAANRLPTRQIANAMAGVPQLKWRTSLDRCSKTPSSAQVGYNAAICYRAVYRIGEERAKVS